MSKASMIETLRERYRRISPYFPRILNPESAKQVRLIDGRVEDEDSVFSAWQYVEDRHGGFSIRHTWVILNKQNAYSHPMYDEDGNVAWARVSGLIELIQFKSKSVQEYCTVIGDMSRAEIQECN